MVMCMFICKLQLGTTSLTFRLEVRDRVSLDPMSSDEGREMDSSMDVFTPFTWDRDLVEIPGDLPIALLAVVGRNVEAVTGGDEGCVVGTELELVGEGCSCWEMGRRGKAGATRGAEESASACA